MEDDDEMIELSAEEVASLVSYLISPAAGYMTGASLTIDGGYVL